MDTSKIIKGVVNSGRYTVTAPIVKEDYGLYLQIEGVELPSTYEVDFSNSEHSGASVTMIGNADGVLIPRQFIDSGKDIFAFLYHVGADFGRTVYKFRIPNKVRPDRTNEEPTPEEQSVIDQAINALNEAVAKTAQDVIDADASAQTAQGYAEQAEDARDNAQTYANSAQTSANNASASASQASASATASAQSAQASANSATQAQGYANSASASAQSASGYASNAQTSANTASNKASEASTSAQTASNKASEASQSASQALTYKTDAESAKVASQTAQGLAESARDSAISAKTDAESAKDDAVQAKTDVQNIADGIDTRLVDVESALIDKAPIITDTASGAIASFSDGADDLPLKSLVVDINPIQDLSNGDPSPENICPISGWTEVNVHRTGKNLVSAIPQNIVRHNGNPTIICDGDNTVTIKAERVAAYDACFYAMTITESMIGLSFTVSAKEFKRGYLKISKFPHGNYSIPPTDVTSSNYHVRTITQDDIGYDFVVRVYNDSGADLTFEQLQLELGSTATPYEPYTGRSITIDLGQTVYGGKLDVLTGKLTVYPYYASYNGETLTGRWISDRDAYAVGTTPTIGAQVVNIGAQGVTVQLEPHEVESLYGVNNIWADSGDTEVVYRADTKLYISKKIAEAISALS